jgi:hypothetical protein
VLDKMTSPKLVRDQPRHRCVSNRTAMASASAQFHHLLPAVSTIAIGESAMISER